MELHIITPDQKVFEGESSSTTLPGVDGTFQILSDHAPLVSSLGEGNVVVKTDEGDHVFAISGGVVEVLNNKVVVLAESLVE